MYQIISVCYAARDVEIKVVFDELIRVNASNLLIIEEC